MAPLEIVYEVPLGLYQRALRAYLWRKVGGFAIGAALALVLAAAVAPSEPWLSGFLAGLALAYLLNLARLQRGAMRLARESGAGPVTLRIDETGVSFSSPRGEWKILRQNLRAVLRVGEVVELDLGKEQQPVWIPAQAVSGVPFARLQELAGGTAGAPS